MNNSMVHVLKGNLELFSPAIIGSGESNETDIDLLVDHFGMPFIPATSLAGVLRSLLADFFSSTDLQNLFGYTAGTSSQASLLLFSDLKPKAGIKIRKRTGVKIDSITQRAEEQKLYEYQIIEKGTFELKIEAKTHDDNDKCLVEKAFALFNHLFSKEIQVGAKTNSGFGKLGVKNGSQLEYYRFDLSSRDDLISWLNGNKYPDRLKQPFQGNLIIPVRKQLSLEANFLLKTSLIIRDYSVKPHEPDAVSLRSNDTFVISGTSLKGALRGRAERILNTLGNDPNKTEALLNDLFGFVKIPTEENTQQRIAVEKKQQEKAQKGRLKVSEVMLKDYNDRAEQQTRIKIDRFTGGAMDGALFEEMPVFSGPENDPTKFNIQIEVKDYKDWEVGLLLLLLKDLWTGDLPIGGEKSIGRGILRGTGATLKLQISSGNSCKQGIVGAREYSFPEAISNEETIKELDQFVKAIQERLNGTGENNNG